MVNKGTQPIEQREPPQLTKLRPTFSRPANPDNPCRVELILAKDRVWDIYVNGEWKFSRRAWDNVISELQKLQLTD